MAEGTLELVTICNFKLFGVLSCIRTFSVVSNYLDIALISSILGSREIKCVQYGDDVVQKRFGKYNR